MALPDYTVWFRGLPACPCLAEWLPVFERELLRLGIRERALRIFQLIGDADASAGVHSRGGAFDIEPLGTAGLRLARDMGADATWDRIEGWDDKHAHGVLRGCLHNGPAAYQIAEVDNGGDGLTGTAPDPGPRPLSGRTWRQGIEWARQQEDDMPTPEETRQIVREEIERAVPKIAEAVLASEVIARLDVTVREALRDSVNKADHRKEKP